MDTEQLVYSMIKEAIKIGMQDVDQEKSIGGFKNMSGEFIPNIEVKPNREIFFIVESSGDPIPNPRIKEIGIKFHQLGGLELMQEAYYEITKSFGIHGPNLKYAWINVGDWRN